MKPDPKPLDAGEFARIARWHRGMMAFYAVAMTVLTAAALGLPRVLDQSVANRAILALLLFFIVVGGWVQFRERCPRCATRLGRQSRFMVPRVCGGCGVRLTADGP